MAEEQVKLTETIKGDAKQAKKVTFGEEIKLECRMERSKPMTKTVILREMEPRFKRPTIRKIHKDTKKNNVIIQEDKTTKPLNGDRPELNSILSLAERIQTLDLERFDAKEAVKSKLETCQVTRQKLEEISAKQVNHPQSYVVFRDIVSLEFDEEALLRAAAEEKEAKVRAVQPVPRPRDPEPKLEDFVTEDELFQPEFARFPTVSVDFEEEFKRTVTAPSRSAYNLYRHLLRWEED